MKQKFRTLILIETMIEVEDDPSSGLTNEERAHEEAGELADLLQEQLSRHRTTRVEVGWVFEVGGE